MSKRKQATIPIFLPEMGCGHKCVFCNQRQISGQARAPRMTEIREIIHSYLKTMGPDRKIQIGFFGGSFTGLAQDYQKKCLDLAQEYINKGLVDSIRISTRPDYLSVKTLEFLNNYGVETIELGVQSMSDEVLAKARRGHTAKQTIQACRLIKQHGYRLGVQIMLGLPGDTLAAAKATARKMAHAGADDGRIYPVLVVENTELAAMFRSGKYKPLSLRRAVIWTSEILRIWQDQINVIKVGLHPTKDFLRGQGYLAGPYHPSFRELVLSRMILREILRQVRVQSIKSAKHGRGCLQIETHPHWMNFAVGYKQFNKKLLNNYFKHVYFTQNQGLNPDLSQIQEPGIHVRFCK